MPRQKKIKKDFTYAVGRRREAAARVRIFRGKGETTVNSKPIESYFSGLLIRSLWEKPFKVVDAMDKYYATVRVAGGGAKGQLDAVTHGIARALAKVDIDFRKPLKDAGLLTRDPRGRERRKVATGGKARRKKQSPKR